MAKTTSATSATNAEKSELMKSAIFQLYSKEGRSICYISRLLEINRKTLSEKIEEWDIPKPKPTKYVKPSTQKFINKNRALIKSRLDNDISITKIAEELQVERSFLQKTIIPNDEILYKAKCDYIKRKQSNAEECRNEILKNSRQEYIFSDLPGEIWRPILGYEGYMVSNKGRIKKYAKRYKAYYLIAQTLNKNNGRLYACLFKGNKRKNMQVARIVAHAFVDGFDGTHNTVNHEDGNVQNNEATNLTWTSQSENNKHSYTKLNRQKVNFKKYKFKKIIYKEKYEFKTVAALARFLGKSETQTRRYLDYPEKHNLQLCN